MGYFTTGMTLNETNLNRAIGLGDYDVPGGRVLFGRFDGTQANPLMTNGAGFRDTVTKLAWAATRSNSKRSSSARR